jgi:hypothetical protein
MNDQLERDLLESFDRRASAPVDASALAVVAVRRGRRLRVRAYAVRVLSGVVALALVGVGGVLGARALRPDAMPVGVAPSPTETKTRATDAEPPPPGGWKVPALPVAKGVAGAGSAPQKVGRDAGLLHFTVDGFAGDSEFTTWTSREGSESVEFRKGGTSYEVNLAPTAAALDALRDWRTSGNGDAYLPGASLNATPLPAPDEQQPATVGGRPATVYSWSKQDPFYVRWQPVDGLWVDVVATRPDSTAEDALAVAAKVRLDQAYRCASPVRLSHAAPFGPLRLCQVTLWGAEKTDAKGRPTRLLGALLVAGSGQNQLRVESGAARERTGQTGQTTEIDGHQARQFENQVGQPALEVFDVGGVDVLMSGRVTVTELNWLAAGLVVTGDGRDPASWPTPAIG